MHNVERHPTRRGLYIGYCNGPWHIKRDHRRMWTASEVNGSGYQVFSGLREASEWLEAQAAKTRTTA